MGQSPAGARRTSTLVQGSVSLLVGLGLSLFGYATSSTVFNAAEVVGPALFWFAVVVLLLAFPLREDAAAFGRCIRSALGSVVFALYLAVHLVVYGFLLEVVLSSAYGVSSTLTPSLIVATEVFTPLSPANALYTLSFNPSISFTLPPILSGALSFYAIAVAILVDLMILSNLEKTRQLGRVCTAMEKARSYFLVPALGLVLGASCCVSVPGLIAYAYPSLVSSSSFAWVYDVSYFLFPVFALAILYLNARSIDRIAGSFARGAPAG